LNFDFSDEQKTLKVEVRRFLEARCTSAVTRRVLNDDDVAFDRDLWRAVAEQGWLGAVIPEMYGGVGLGRVDLCVLAEEMGRVVAPIPFGSTVYVFAEAILIAGTDEQKATLLPKLASGEIIGCLATSEGPGPVAVERLKSNVAAGRLSGDKAPVIDGDVATHAIVLARGKEGLGLYLVDLSAKKVTREPLNSLDPTRSVARVNFSGAVCEPLGNEGEGEALLSRILDRAAVLFAFEQVGGADRCLDMAKAYALQRYAFGRIIASFQAIKHKLADIYIKNELARSSAYYAAWALSAEAAELPVAAAAARVAGSNAYDFASKENLQTHGGMGFAWDVDCHVHLRRSRQLALALGAPAVWRERLVQQLEGRNAG
jgi:alkylation response protein AidB-like acyl-CoA dehydrogenase